MPQEARARFVSIDELTPILSYRRFNGFGNGARPDAKARRYDRQLRCVLLSPGPGAVRAR